MKQVQKIKLINAKIMMSIWKINQFVNKRCKYFVNKQLILTQKKKEEKFKIENN